MQKEKKLKYNLRVQIGKKPRAAGLKKRVYNFETDDPAKSLNTINIPKMMETCFFTLEQGGKKALMAMNSLRARRIFNNKLNAFFFIKNLKNVMK